MVPTFVSVHMFCTSHKVMFNQYMHAEFGIDIINYTTKYMTKMKEKSFLLWPNNLMILYLKQEHQNSRLLLTTNC